MVSIYPDRFNHVSQNEIKNGEPTTPLDPSEKKSNTHSLCQCLFDNMQFLFFSHSFSRKRKIIRRKNSQLIFPSQKISHLSRRTTVVQGMPEYKFNPPQSHQTCFSKLSECASSECKMEQ